jgi:putative transposase
VTRANCCEEQVAFALNRPEVGTPVKDVRRNMGMSDATSDNVRNTYGRLGPSEVRRPRQLEDENNRLKRLVAAWSSDKAMMQDVLITQDRSPRHDQRSRTFPRPAGARTSPTSVVMPREPRIVLVARSSTPVSSRRVVRLTYCSMLS